MKLVMKSVLMFLALFVSASICSATVFYVTPSSALYPTPCQAIYSNASWSLGGPTALAGDTIEIDYNNGIPYTEKPDANHGGRSDCKITQNNLTIIGVNGRAVLDGSPSTGVLAGTGIYYQKGILDVYAHGVTISNLEIRGATNSFSNGNNGTGVMINSGGIGGNLIEGGSITIEYCYIHDNNDGVRSTANTSTVGQEYFNTGVAATPPFITLQYDELANNGNDCVQTACAHNMYIGPDETAVGAAVGVTNFNMYYSWSHDAWIGHSVKDRNAINNLYYNLIGDAEGNTSNVLDFPLGGSTYIVGNVLYKTNAINTPQNGGNASKAFMTWADVGDNSAGGPEYGVPFQDLHFINNTEILDPGSNTPTFVVIGCQNSNYSNCSAPNNGPAVTTPAVVQNNIFIGPAPGIINQTGAHISNNLLLTNNSVGGVLTPGTLDNLTNGSNVTSLFVDAAHFNFNLLSSAATAIGQGKAVPTDNVGAADPKAVAHNQYVHPSDASSRSSVTDIGAYQFASTFTSPSGLTVTNSGPVTTPGTGTITISGLPTSLSTVGTYHNVDFWSENPAAISFFSPGSSSTSAGVNSGPGGQDGVAGPGGLYGTGEEPSATSFCNNALAPIDAGSYAGCPVFNGTLTTTFTAYASGGGSIIVPVDIYVDGEHLTTDITVNPGAVAISSVTIDTAGEPQTSVHLTNPPASAIVVDLSSPDNSSGFLAFPSTVTIPAGSVSAEVGSEIGALWGTSPPVENVTLTATYGASSASVVVPIASPVPRHFYWPTTSAVGGQSIAGDLGFETDCPASGCPVTVTSDNLAAIPSQIFTVQGGSPGGYSDGSGGAGYFRISLQTNSVTTTTVVNISMNGNGFTCTYKNGTTVANSQVLNCPATAQITLSPPGAGVPVYLLVAPSNSGNNQSAIIGTTFTNPLVALVTDINHTPIAGVAVTFAGTGVIFPSGATAVTNASGLASVVAQPTIVGAITVNPSATGIGTTASFSETGLVGTGSATGIAVVSGAAQTANVGLNFSSPLVAIVTGSGGVPVAGATVTFASSGATFPGGNTAVTGSNGQASVTASPSKSGSLAITASTAGVGTPATFTETGFGSIWTVGPTGEFATPCPAIHAASPGDIIQVDYNNGVPYQEPLDPYPSPTNGSGAARNDCVWYTKGLTIEGVNGRPIMDGTGLTFQKGIFNPRGANETFVNLEVRNAYCDTAAQGYNCAAIRVDSGSTASPAGGDITVQYCYLHDNDNGILTANTGASVGAAYLDPNPYITLQYDEIYNNGSTAHPGYEHNMYIGFDGSATQTFNLEYTWSHDANVGHTVKSRSSHNNLYYDLIGDALGNTSYVLDFPLGGSTYIVGSTIYKTATTNSNSNRGFMVWADAFDNTPTDPEFSIPNQDLHFVNNTVLLDPGNNTQAYVVISCNNSSNATCGAPGNGPAVTTPAVVQNNLLVGPNVEVVNQPTAVQSHNLVVVNNSTGGGDITTLTNGSNVAGLFVNAGAYNFNLATGSAAIGGGLATPTLNDGTTADPKAKAVYQLGNSGTFASGSFRSNLADRPNVTDLGAFYKGVVVTAAPSSIAVSSGNNQSSLVGTNYTNPLVVVVLDQSSNPFAGATVTFAGTGTLFPTGFTAITDGNGLASVTAQPNAAGTFSVTATVNGYAAAGTATFTETGTNGTSVGTTTALTSTLNPSTAGQSVTFTATVTQASGPTIPTGTVQFSVNGSAVGSAVTLNSGGQGTYTTSTLAVGTSSITAVYTATGSFTGSTSSALSQVVNAGATTTALTSSLNPSNSGQAVTFTATVSPSTATGTVTFKNGAAVLGTGTLSGGVATYSTTTLPVGTDSITAVYGGDSNDAGSTSNTVSQVVNGGTGNTPQTINFPTIATQLYNPPPITLTATASSGLTVSYAISYGPATVSGNTLTVTNTGSGDIKVCAMQAGNATYKAATPVCQIFVVLPNGFSWPIPASITYGTPLPAALSTVTAGTFAYYKNGVLVSAGAILPAGVYGMNAIFTPQAPGATLKISVRLVVTPAPLTVTASNVSAAYGSQVPVYAYTITGTFYGSDTLASSVTGVPTITATASSHVIPSGVSVYTAPVGSYSIKPTFGSLKSSNYTFNFVAGSLTLTKAANITVTAKNVTVTKAANVPSTYSYTVSGLSYYDTIANATTGTPSVTSTATTSSPAGSYTITAAAGSFAASSNYMGVTYINGTLTIQ